MNILPIDETRNLFGNIALSDENYAAWLEELHAAGSGELAALFAGN